MSTYIILVAGKGTSLYPLTLQYPKTSYRLNQSTTVLQRMVKGIRKFDPDAEIAVVSGYLADSISDELEEFNVNIVKNPFYEVTNSIASLWFARDFLERENVAIIHGDVVLDDKLMESCITSHTDAPYVLFDSTSNNENAYYVVSNSSRVLVMSKKLTQATGSYACVTKLDAVSARLLKDEVNAMINNGMSNQYYEDALVQMIMFQDFQLYAKDIAGYSWSETNSVNDLLEAQNIQEQSEF